MKRSLISLILLIGIIAAFGCASRQPCLQPETAAVTDTNRQPREYLIQPGDQLDIKFFYNPEINETLTVRPDGKISLQLVDEIQAAGLKPSQLDEILTEKYAQELKQPVLTVIVKSFGGQRIYVGGEVQSQGIITLAGDMTPLQAVFNAGGFKESANPECTIIIRKGSDNRPIPIAMNLENVMQGKSGSAEFMLHPNDIVYVPKTAIAKANKFVNEYIERLLLFKGVSFGFSYDLNDGDDD